MTNNNNLENIINELPHNNLNNGNYNIYFLDYNNKKGEIKIIENNKEKGYPSVILPLNKVFFGMLYSVETEYTDKSGEIKKITVKNINNEEEEAVAITMIQGNNKFIMKKKIKLIYLNAFINKLLNCDLEKDIYMYNYNYINIYTNKTANSLCLYQFTDLEEKKYIKKFYSESVKGEEITNKKGEVVGYDYSTVYENTVELIKQLQNKLKEKNEELEKINEEIIEEVIDEDEENIFQTLLNNNNITIENI